MFSPAYVDTFKITTLKESTCSLLLRGRGAQPECQRIYFKHPLSLISLCLSLFASPRFLTLVGSDSLQPRGLCPSGSSALAILQQEYRRACWGLLQGVFPTQGSNLHLFSDLHWQWVLYHWCHLGTATFLILTHLLIEPEPPGEGAEFWTEDR